MCHHHHRPLLHLTERRVVGSADSRPSTCPASVPRVDGSSYESSSAAPPAGRPLSHSSPATPAAASPVSPHSLSRNGGQRSALCAGLKHHRRHCAAMKVQDIHTTSRLLLHFSINFNTAMLL